MPPVVLPYVNRNLRRCGTLESHLTKRLLNFVPHKDRLRVPGGEVDKLDADSHCRVEHARCLDSLEKRIQKAANALQPTARVYEDGPLGRQRWIEHRLSAPKEILPQVRVGST